MGCLYCRKPSTILAPNLMTWGNSVTISEKETDAFFLCTGIKAQAFAFPQPE
jgi:hypothetical protein